MVYADYLAIDDRGEPLEDPDFRPQDRRHPAFARDPPAPRPSADQRRAGQFHRPLLPLSQRRGTRRSANMTPTWASRTTTTGCGSITPSSSQHLGTDEILYSYRVHDRSLSGRAAELRIAERAPLLMDYEGRRQQFYRQAMDPDPGRSHEASAGGLRFRRPLSGPGLRDGPITRWLRGPGPRRVLYLDR